MQSPSTLSALSAIDARNSDLVVPTRTLVMLGAPGSGKGTQAGILSKKFGYRTFSTGDAFRTIVQNPQTATEREIAAMMAKGGLVDDPEVMRIVHDYFEQTRLRIARESGVPLDAVNLAEEKFALDGVPRKKTQVAPVVEKMQSIGHDDPLGVLIHVDDEVAFNNVNFRTEKSGKAGRPDTAPEVVRDRLGVYHTETDAVIDHFAQNDRLVVVNGETGVDIVGATQLLRNVKQLHARAAAGEKVDQDELAHLQSQLEVASAAIEASVMTVHNRVAEKLNLRQ